MIAVQQMNVCMLLKKFWANGFDTKRLDDALDDAILQLESYWFFLDRIFDQMERFFIKRKHLGTGV